MRAISYHRTIGTAIAIAAACTLPAEAGTNYVIRGGDTSMFFQHVHVTDSAYTSITDATVTINGIDIPYVSDARYSGTLDAELNPGDAFTLVVQIGAETVTGTDVVPDLPVITAPLDGASITGGEPLLVEWTSSVDPDRYWILANPCVGDCSAYTDGTARSAELSTEGFSTTEPVRISVLAYNSGTFTGPVDPACNLNLRSETSGPYVTTLPGTPTLTSSWAELKVRFQ